MKTQLLTILLLLSFVISHSQSDTKTELAHEYYKSQFDRGTRLRNIGVGLVAGGATLFVISIPIINSMSYGDAMTTGYFLIISSLIITSAGIPISCAGGAMRHNNRKAMEKLDQNMSLSFGASPNGIGLTLKF
jgi:hypothetical protein